jgi:hypothetical protein
MLDTGFVAERRIDHTIAGILSEAIPEESAGVTRSGLT